MADIQLTIPGPYNDKIYIDLYGFQFDLTMGNNPYTIEDEITKALLFQQYGAHSIITILSEKFKFDKIEVTRGQ